MEFFPRHYSIPRDGKVTSIVVNDRHDLRRLRTELEILRRARRQVVFRCTPFGQAPSGMYSDADHKELETILHDAEHPLVEEMIDHIDRAFPNTRKEIMMSVVNDEAQNIVQEAVETGTIEESEQSSFATNEASADAAIDMLAEAEAKLAKLVEDSDPDADNNSDPSSAVATDPTTPEAQDSTHPMADNNESNTDDTPSSNSPAQGIVEQPNVIEVTQAQAEDTTENTQALDEMESAVEAIAEPPVSEPTDDSSEIENNEDVQSQVEDSTNDTQPGDEIPEPEVDEQADMDDTDKDTAVETTPHDNDVQAVAATEDTQPNPSTDDLTDDAPQEDVPEAESSPTVENLVDASSPVTPASETKFSSYGPEQAQQAVDEIETGIRKLANVLNTQVKDQWTQASDALGDIVEKRTQLEEKLFEAKEMLETLDRSRKEAAISRDAADVARREAELFRDDLRKLRDDAIRVS